MRAARRLTFLSGLAGGSFLLASTSARAAGASTSMTQIANLFWIVAIIGLAIGLFVGIVILITILKWRVRKGHQRPVSTVRTSNHALEAAWTIVPAVILLVIGVLAFETLTFTDTLPQHPDAVLTVIARQWSWEFYVNYTANGTSFHYTSNFVIKANQVVLVQIRSLDVDHSLLIDALGFHLDAIPGHANSGWFEATVPGTYVVRCTQFCGVGHATMVGSVTVLS